MPKRSRRALSGQTESAIIATYLDDRNDDLLDAVVTAAALVARADCWVAPIERSQLLDFFSQKGLLALSTRAEILDALDSRLRELDGYRGAEVALNSLQRLAGSSLARLVIEAGNHIAAADGHLHPHEDYVLQLIRHALRPQIQIPASLFADSQWG